MHVLAYFPKWILRLIYTGTARYSHSQLNVTLLSTWIVKAMLSLREAFCLWRLSSVRRAL